MSQADLRLDRSINRRPSESFKVARMTRIALSAIALATLLVLAAGARSPVQAQFSELEKLNNASEAFAAAISVRLD